MKKIIIIVSLLILESSFSYAEQKAPLVDFNSLSQKSETFNNMEIQLLGKVSHIQVFKAPKGFLVAMDLLDLKSNKAVRITSVLKEKNGAPDSINCNENDSFTAKGIFRLNSHVKGFLGVISLPSFMSITCKSSSATKHEVKFSEVESLAKGEFITNKITIFSQSLKIEIPKNWKLDNPTLQGKYFLYEYLPKNEKIESWNQLLTISSGKDLAKEITLENMYSGEVNKIRKACPNSLINEKVEMPKISGFQTIGAIIGCGMLPQIKDKNEVALYAFIKGKSDIYIIKKSFREDLKDKALKRLSHDNYKKKAPEIFSIKLCKNNGQVPTCLEDSP
jgi:hypothetical protein